MLQLSQNIIYDPTTGITYSWDENEQAVYAISIHNSSGHKTRYSGAERFWHWLCENCVTSV